VVLVSTAHQGNVHPSPVRVQIRSDLNLLILIVGTVVQCQSIGGSMGLNTSCPNHGDTSCQVSCQDPTKANTCVILGALLVDGSPCGMLSSCCSAWIDIVRRIWWNMQ
jgi:hypothetical protein